MSPPPPSAAWNEATDLVLRYLAAPRKADDLLGETEAGPRHHARVQALFYGVLRHLNLLETVIDQLMQKPAQDRFRAFLLVASFAVLDADEKRQPKVVHFAVDQARGQLGKSLSRVVNAVLRKIPAARERVLDAAGDPVTRMALAAAHPEWLVRRWVAHYGQSKTEQLLAWNQQPAETMVRVLGQAEIPPSLRETLVPTPHHEFYRLKRGQRMDPKALRQQLSSLVLAQDPASRLPTHLLAAKPGESVLECCAAPGGKSVVLSHLLGSAGRLVCIDLPGRRTEQLRASLENACPHANHTVVPYDLTQPFDELKAILKSTAAEETVLHRGFSAVLLDAPCSNTGVIRRRPDVRHRLTPEAIDRVVPLQTTLLLRAAEMVQPGGRLVYSTCSLEPEEHLPLDAIGPLAQLGYRKVQHLTYDPLSHGHDGGSAVLFIREGTSTH